MYVTFIFFSPHTYEGGTSLSHSADVIFEAIPNEYFETEKPVSTVCRILLISYLVVHL